MALRAPGAMASGSDDPVLAAFLRAPVDTRPESEEERAAVEAAKLSGPVVSHADVVAAIHRRAAE